MNSSIYTLKKSVFPYDDLSLANPHGLQGGAYFSKLKLLGKTISFQTPKSKTKNGIIKTDKKIYCDLLFDKDDDDVIEFLTELEDKIKNLIYEKKDKWFHTDMDMDTIDYHWQNVLRPYKGSHVLLRCFIKKPKNTLNSAKTIQIYNEEEQLLDLDKVTKDKTIVSLLDLTGLKFTSQSFSLEFNLTQVMILNDEIKRNKCLIKKDTTQETKTLEKLNENTKNLEETEKTATFSEKQNIETEEIVSQNENLKLVSDISDIISSEEVNNNVQNNLEKEKEDKSKEPENNTEIEETVDTKEDNNLVVTDDLEKNTEVKLDENPNELEELNEINLEIPSELDSVHLKKPNEVYLEIYKEVKKRAKEAKKKAIEAYLEAKRIKSLYLLDEIESSDDEGELLAITDDV
jgi:hypothetical protein